jgi:regulator of sigma E protease
LISLNLGLINLLPIPALDGGHLTYLVVEGIIRRELSVKTKLLIQQVGVALIIMLTLFVVYNDIIRVMHH